MPVTKAPPGTITKPSGKQPIPLPDEISPTVYIKQFVEWLQTSKPGATLHNVHLRMVWLHSPSEEEDGVVTYGEIGADGQSVADMTLTLGMTSDLKKFLRGKAVTYRSDQRYLEPAPPNGVSQKQSPFDPDKKGQVEVTIWSGTGEVNLRFLPNRVTWTIQPTYAAASNLLFGAPTGKDAPAIKPLVVLSLSKHQSDDKSVV